MKKQITIASDDSIMEPSGQSTSTLSSEGQHLSHSLTPTDEAELLISAEATRPPNSSPITVGIDELFSKIHSKALVLSGAECFSPSDPGFEDPLLYDILVTTMKSTPVEPDLFVPPQVSAAYSFLSTLTQSAVTTDHACFLPFALQLLTLLEEHEEVSSTPFPLVTVKKYLLILKTSLS